MRLIDIVSVGIAIGMLLGCKSRKSDASPQITSPGGDATKATDLAEQFCTGHGGVPKGFSSKDGNQIRACVFGSAKIELLTLYSANKNTASNVFMAGRVPTGASSPQLGNPAAVFCEANGGQGETALEDGGEFSFCKFGDGSMIEEWTLFKGHNSADNQKLKAALLAARS